MEDLTELIFHDTNSIIFSILIVVYYMQLFIGTIYLLCKNINKKK